MIRTWHRMRAAVRADFRQRGVPVSARSFLWDPTARFMVLLRFNELLKNAGAPLPVRALPYLWFRRLSIRLGYTVPLNVCAPGLAIIHYGTLVIADKARVGRNCRIHVGAHIGGSPRGGCPVIGSHCYIGPGAKIFGPVRIGNHCKVGANAVVSRSFPDHSTIVTEAFKAVSEPA